jgi:hypothetical protein
VPATSALERKSENFINCIGIGGDAFAARSCERIR